MSAAAKLEWFTAEYLKVSSGPHAGGLAQVRYSRCGTFTIVRHEGDSPATYLLEYEGKSIDEALKLRDIKASAQKFADGGKRLLSTAGEEVGIEDYAHGEHSDGALTYGSSLGSAAAWLYQGAWFFRVWKHGAPDICARGSETSLGGAEGCIMNCFAAMIRGEL